jgi:hypothetical protein
MPRLLDASTVYRVGFQGISPMLRADVSTAAPLPYCGVKIKWDCETLKIVVFYELFWYLKVFFRVSQSHFIFTPQYLPLPSLA